MSFDLAYVRLVHLKKKELSCLLLNTLCTENAFSSKTLYYVCHVLYNLPGEITVLEHLFACGTFTCNANCLLYHYFFIEPFYTCLFVCQLDFLVP